MQVRKENGIGARISNLRPLFLSLPFIYLFFISFLFNTRMSFPPDFYGLKIEVRLFFKLATLLSCLSGGCDFVILFDLKEIFMLKRGELGEEMFKVEKSGIFSFIKRMRINITENIF